jgi:hypothetical protein
MSGDRKGVDFSVELLKSHGCGVCVWKETGDCPYGYVGSEGSEEGYCDKLVNHLDVLAGDSGSVDVAMERFHAYVRSLQSMLDRKDMVVARDAYFSAMKSGAHPSELMRLRSEWESMKMWWFRCSESAGKSLGRLNDREFKRDVDVSVTHKLDLSQVHRLVNGERRLLEERKDE